MLYSSMVLGKPYKAEPFNRVDPTSIQANPTLNLDVNATSILRSKRDDSEKRKFLRNYCSTPPLLTQQQLGSRHSCEAGSYMCYGRAERVCKGYSFACLESILRVGSMKCAPHYTWVTINLGAEGNRSVRWTENCSCA